VTLMIHRSMVSMAVLGVTMATWGCPENDTGHSHPDSDATAPNTDEASDSSEDTDVPFNSGSDPDLLLGEDLPETLYDGFEDQYILTADDDPVDVCRVRFKLHAVARPAVSCAVCEWEVVVEKSDPEILSNQNDACAHSELGLDDASIAAQVGERIAYGFAPESVGHANILMRYNTESKKWEEYTVSNWDSLQSLFRYKRRDGMCAYAAEGDTVPSISGICGISGEATVTLLMNATDR
jgi:hypothetical protein